MFCLGIILPLLGALAGGLCVVVKSRADHEINQRQLTAASKTSAKELDAREKADADLRARADQATRRAQELETKLNTRQITPEQRSKFVDLVEFADKGKVTVCVTEGVDSATMEYANQIREMLNAGGYQSGDTVKVEPGRQIPAGLFMLVKHQHHPFAGAIQQAFVAIEISATGLIDESVPDGEVQIDVGVKP
jgi:hypothetical protein